jgi:hypothetical protein
MDLLKSMRRTLPPDLSTPPTYWQLRRMCRWQARQLRLLVDAPAGPAANQQRAREQIEWIESVLRHHPLLDDLQRTIRQSANLLRELAPVTFPPEQP